MITALLAASLAALTPSHALARVAQILVQQLGARGDEGAGGAALTVDVKLGDQDDEQEPNDGAEEETALDQGARVRTPHVDIRIPRSGARGLAVPPVPPAPPAPPRAPLPPRAPTASKAGRFSVNTKDATAVEVLHRIAQAAGWSLTVSDVGDEPLSLDLTEVDPRDAVRAVLKQSRAWAVLRGNELVVVPAGEVPERAGQLIEGRGRRGRLPSGKKHDLVRVMQGDLVVPRGTVVQGDALVVGGTLTVEPGALVQGDAVAVLGNILVEPGGLVMGDGVTVLGKLDLDPSGQILGEHVQLGVGKVFRGRRGFFDRLGLFGFFPTLALFALLYLVGLFALVLAPERLRGISTTLLASPLRSFAVGFLSWLLVVPLAVLLCVTLVGIPLLPLLPLVLFLSFALGLSALALRIGELLPAGPGQKFVPTAALAMGMGVLALVAFLPLVGLPVLVLAQFAAIGAVVASRAGKPPLGAVAI